MTETHAPFGMTPEIAAAICTVMKKVRRLEKDDKNKFDNYNFTSVDRFFEFVNPLMAEAGLMVHYDETGQEYYTNKKESLWMRSRFAIYLCHESGAMAGPFNRTVAVPMTGAQSYGSAQSYALKQFLRATFLIPTGEKDDADHNAKDDHQAAPDTPQSVNTQHAIMLRNLIEETGVDEAVFLKFYGAESVDTFPAAKFAHAKEKLEAKRTPAPEPEPEKETEDATA